MVNLSTTQRWLLNGYLILGVICGLFFIPGKSYLLNAAIGFIVALFSSYLIFPQLKKHFPNLLKSDTIWADSTRRFSHPTQLPQTIGILWFLISISLLAFLIYEFPSLIPEEVRLLTLFYVVLIPTHFLIGLSGYKIIRRKETVNNFGQVYRGGWAYLAGVLTMIYGWGGVILMVLALIIWKE
jgi:hypothetical protein